VIVLCLLVPLQCRAQVVSNASSTVDGAGQFSSAVVTRNLSAVGQSGGISVSSGGGVRNYAGFLGTFGLQPHLHSDSDGLPDEFDADNDDDGLEDAEEIAGSAFDPVTPSKVNDPDSDGDGLSDGDESVAGTNPNDSWHCLRIVSCDDTPAGTVVGWLARSNLAYRVCAGDALSHEPAFPLDLESVTGHGPAHGAWQILTNFYTDTNTAPGAARFYIIKVE
jgi:hypothetical protein